MALELSHNECCNMIEIVEYNIQCFELRLCNFISHTKSSLCQEFGDEFHKHAFSNLVSFQHIFRQIFSHNFLCEKVVNLVLIFTSAAMNGSPCSRNTYVSFPTFFVTPDSLPPVISWCCVILSLLSLPYSALQQIHALTWTAKVLR